MNVRTGKRWQCISGLLLMLSGAVAYAHAHLQKADPANGSVITASPANIVLSFSEPARITAFWIQKGDGEKQKVGSLPTQAARQVSVAIPQLTPGTYTVSWRVVGDDNHVVPGQIHFTLAPGSGPASPPTSH